MTDGPARRPRPPGTVASRRSDLAVVTAAVRAFKTRNGRTPTFDETCALMSWTPHHTWQVLAATNPAPPPHSASPPPSTATGPPLPPEPLVAEPLVADQPGPIPLPPPDGPDAPARRQAWRWLTAHHQTPTERAVTARARDATAAHAARLRRQARSLDQAATAAATAAAIAAQQGPRARQWIADYRAAYHQGPLWRELADAMGWPPTAGPSANTSWPPSPPAATSPTSPTGPDPSPPDRAPTRPRTPNRPTAPDLPPPTRAEAVSSRRYRISSKPR